jgi:hypothetical protein
MCDIRKPKMNMSSNVKYLTPEETKKAWADATIDGVASSRYLSEMPEYEQERIKQKFALTFKDDRSAYHREYDANMKAKEANQIISDEEEERIIKEYSKYKEFNELRAQAMKEKAFLEKTLKEVEQATIASSKAKEEWNNKKNEVPDVVVHFD